jgi:ankyrin repeat protein
VNRSSFLSQLFHSHISRIFTISLIILAWSISAFCGEIHDAAKAGDLTKARALLKDNPELVSSRDDKGYTPLHLAAVYGHKAVAELFLANKADVNARIVYKLEMLDLITLKPLALNNNETIGHMDDGPTPLHLAVDNGHKDIAELLLANKAEVNALDTEGCTPLHEAAFRGNKEIAALLLAGKANVHASDCSKRDTEEDFSILLEEFSFGPPHGGYTPLHLAAKQERMDVIELLIAKGAKVNSQDNDGWMPLHFAALKGHMNVVQLLLTKGAEVNAETFNSIDDGNKTPLYLAAWKGRKDVAELLLAKHANVNARTQYGWTPLHSAANFGYRDMVELLLANKAEVNAKTNLGQMPLDLAARGGHKDVEEFLRRHGGHE